MLLLAKDSQWGWAIVAAFGCHKFVLDWSDCARRVQAKTFHQLLYIYQRAAPSLMLIKWVCCCMLSHRCHLPHLKPLLHSDSRSRLLIAHAQFQPPVFRGLRKSAKWALNIFVIHSVMLWGFCCRNINVSRLEFQWSSCRICRNCTPLPLPPLHPKYTKVWDRQVCQGFWYLFVDYSASQLKACPSVEDTENIRCSWLFPWCDVWLIAAILWAVMMMAIRFSTQFFATVHYQVSRLLLVLFLHLCWFSH